MADKSPSPSIQPPGGWGTSAGRLALCELFERHGLSPCRRTCTGSCNGGCRGRSGCAWCQIIGGCCGGRFMSLGCPKCTACKQCRSSSDDREARDFAEGRQGAHRPSLDNLPAPTRPDFLGKQSLLLVLPERHGERPQRESPYEVLHIHAHQDVASACSPARVLSGTRTSTVAQSSTTPGRGHRT